MRPTFIVLTLIGLLIALAGTVFILQGEGIVGPQSSFMFSNPTWVYQGAAVAAMGLILLIVSLVLGKRKSTPA